MTDNANAAAIKNSLTIGQLAALAQVNVETIRYYQRRGLLDEPSKPLGGHRRYAVETARRVRSSSGRSNWGSRWKRLKACCVWRTAKVAARRGCWPSRS